MSDEILRAVDGGVTAAKGFLAAGLPSGIKKRGGPDLALIATDSTASIAAVFTKNRIQGATVRLCRERLGARVARAVIVNSGNANACTGPGGLEDARRMGKITADELGVDESEVFVCSTGVIGVPLPMDCLETGIPQAVALLAPDGGGMAARAIMTTDTRPKEVAVSFPVGGTTVTLGGMAKGAGMIEPNMATMLAFLTTDAAVEGAFLQECLSDAVSDSFNRITVDGDQSCNDTVLLLANGNSGSPVLDAGHPDADLFRKAVAHVALRLAWSIVEDGEGATKFVTVRVEGAATARDAKAAARRVANSLLVKTSWFGCDPNWGRVIDAVGHSGVELVEERISITYDDVVAVSGGMAAPTPLADLEAVLARDRFTVNIDLDVGDGTAVVYTCDCSEEYVRINSDYTT